MVSGEADDHGFRPFGMAVAWPSAPAKIKDLRPLVSQKHRPGHALQATAALTFGRDIWSQFDLGVGKTRSSFWPSARPLSRGLMTSDNFEVFERRREFRKIFRRELHGFCRAGWPGRATQTQCAWRCVLAALLRRSSDTQTRTSK